MLSKKVFDDCIEEIVIVFDFTMTKSRADVWYKYARHLEDKVFMDKVESCIKGCHRVPTLADILDQKKYYEREKVTEYPDYEKDDYEYKMKIPKDFKDKIDRFTKGMESPDDKN